MDVYKVRRRNLAKVVDQIYGGNAAKFAREAGKSRAYINSLLAGEEKDYSKSIGERIARDLERTLGYKDGTLSDPEFDVVARYDINVQSSNDSASAALGIDVCKARGSCGGGRLNESVPEKYTMFREPDFFYRFQIRPEHIIAVYADGDSMAPYIQDGDVVMFDRRMTTIVSGQIYLIDHPDGLKIKTLRKEINGTLVLGSLNADKVMYPDERIDASQIEYLTIRGKFFYRQGG